MRGSVVLLSACASSTTAPARVAASFERYRLPVKKLMCRASARSSEATWCTRVSALPASRPPSRCTISLRVSGPATGFTADSLRGGRLAPVEGLYHPVGDVDARAREDGVLEDDVVLLLLGDLTDDPVRLLYDLGQLLVATLVQVLAEFALLPLEVAVQLVELALLGAPLVLGHGDAVLLQVVLHALELVGEPRELLVAFLELRFDLLLRALRRYGIAQDALGIDKAELASKRRRGRGRGGLVLGARAHAGGCQRRRREQS